jgi:hypothetical protein
MKYKTYTQEAHEHQQPDEEWDNQELLGESGLFIRWFNCSENEPPR